MGFAGNLAGTGYQSSERAGLNASDVPNLLLRWALAFSGGTNVRTSPTVAGDAALVAGPFGEVVALDLGTGCVRWSYEADAMIRGAIVVGEGPEGRSTGWFVDARTNAYAVDLESGSLLWKHRVGRHAAAYGTGTPALYDGQLFVPVSSLEVAVAGDPRYECCTSSGAAWLALGQFVAVEFDHLCLGTILIWLPCWTPSVAVILRVPNPSPVLGPGKSPSPPLGFRRDSVIVVASSHTENPAKYQRLSKKRSS